VNIVFASSSSSSFPVVKLLTYSLQLYLDKIRTDDNDEISNGRRYSVDTQRMCWRILDAQYNTQK
jgi:hypothetical protein